MNLRDPYWYYRYMVSYYLVTSYLLLHYSILVSLRSCDVYACIDNTRYYTASIPRSPLPKSPPPLPKESQQLIDKVGRQELEEHARRRRMSSQMSDMLGEAEEALGFYI